MGRKTATTHRRRGGVIVKMVEPESLAADCGLEPGDKIWSINGHVIPDSLSFTFNIAHPELSMDVEKGDGEHWSLEIENDPDASFGVTLEEDPIMLCRNKCIFCFVDQNPKGYRRSLLIKDEDIRLSFMYGNYSTLSSTDAAEEARIIREKISPLYVSVHATDPPTRVFMLKSKKAGNILERLQKFAERGIAFHAQVVLCPGVNDGAVLDKTFNDLATLHPMCKSIAVVPLGITKHRQGLTQLTPVSDEYCRQAIAFCEPYRRRFERELDYPLVFLGDEFYIRAGEPLPAMTEYRDFPQMENGVGMARRFIDEFETALAEAALPAGLCGTLATGTLFGPVLTELVEKMNRTRGTEIRVAPIRNDSFGADLINVAGLVHGIDMANQLDGQTLGDFLVVPHVMLKDADADPITIDDWRPNRLARSLGAPVVASGDTAGDLLETLADWRSRVISPGFSTRALSPEPV